MIILAICANNVRNKIQPTRIMKFSVERATPRRLSLGLCGRKRLPARR